MQCKFIMIESGPANITKLNINQKKHILKKYKFWKNKIYKGFRK